MFKKTHVFSVLVTLFLLGSVLVGAFSRTDASEMESTAPEKPVRATGQDALGETTFLVRIENISDGTAFPSPFAPGVWAVHSADDPFFTAGAPDRGLGLEAIAEDGDPSALAAVLPGQTGIETSGQNLAARLFLSFPREPLRPVRLSRLSQRHQPTIITSR